MLISALILCSPSSQQSDKVKKTQAVAVKTNCLGEVWHKYHFLKRLWKWSLVLGKYVKFRLMFYLQLFSINKTFNLFCFSPIIKPPFEIFQSETGCKQSTNQESTGTSPLVVPADLLRCSLVNGGDRLITENHPEVRAMNTRASFCGVIFSPAVQRLPKVFKRSRKQEYFHLVIV